LALSAVDALVQADDILDEEGMMQAEVGDRIVVRGRHTDDGDREGVITEVHGADGAPPYLVRWVDGHETVFTPASGTLVEHTGG
jgi:hypothetical protein